MALSCVCSLMRMVLVMLGKTQTRNLQRRIQGPLVTLKRSRTLLFSILLEYMDSRPACDLREDTDFTPSNAFAAKQMVVKGVSHTILYFILIPVDHYDAKQRTFDCNRSVAVFCGFFTSITIRGISRNEESGVKQFSGFLH